MASAIDVVGGQNFAQEIFSSSWLGWSGNLLLLGLIALLGLVLVHMLSVAFNLNQLRVWVKGEYMQVIATFILAGVIIALVGLLWGVMLDFVSDLYWSNPVLAQKALGEGIVEDSYFDPFAFVQFFLKQTMIDCEAAVYRTLYSINFYYKIVGSLKTETLGTEPVGGWYSTLYIGFFEYVMGHLNFLFLLHWLQIRLLSVVKYAAPLLMQIGLLLRVIPYSRGAGGMLIAMGLGFFAVYPMSLAILITLQTPGASFCTEFVPPAMLDVTKEYGPIDSATVVRAKESLEGRRGEIGEIFEKAKNFIPLFYMQAMFFPMVALIITFTFIRQTGAIFGSDLNEIGRGLVKLI